MFHFNPFTYFNSKRVKVKKSNKYIIKERFYFNKLNSWVMQCVNELRENCSIRNTESKNIDNLLICIKVKVVWLRKFWDSFNFQKQKFFFYYLNSSNFQSVSILLLPPEISKTSWFLSDLFSFCQVLAREIRSIFPVFVLVNNLHWIGNGKDKLKWKKLKNFGGKREIVLYIHYLREFLFHTGIEFT